MITKLPKEQGWQSRPFLMGWTMKKESIEGIFNQEIREKRIAARGARNKVTGVKKNGCFPHETLKGQALKDYKGNSPVKHYFISREEAQKL